jgi:hypothetical protein
MKDLSESKVLIVDDDPSSGRFTYSSTGHPAPAVRRDGPTILWPQDSSHGVGTRRALPFAPVQ